MDLRKIMHNCFNKDRDKIKINANNTIHHEIVKAVVCVILNKNNHRFYTEGVFKNKSRADIIDIDEQTIIEILNTETTEQLLKKEYPLYIYPIKLDSEIKEAVDRVYELLKNKLWKL
jgi:glutathionyl-hydroquinone reductase